MQTIEATYHINTPMFIGGAEPKGDSELRLSSFKGVLRFWWRALADGRLNGDLEKIKREEEEIFGSTKKQADLIFSLQNKEYTLRKTGSVHDKLANSNGLLYLGYGVCEAFGSNKRNTKKGQLTRTCINEDQEFIVKICSKKVIPNDVKVSLQVLGLLGGLGSKARKGYGSVTLQSLQENGKEVYSCPANNADLIQQIKSLFQNNNELLGKLPEYTAFSKYTRIDLIKSGDNALHLLNQIGETMQLYRSWGSNGKVNINGQDAEKNFPEDHDIAQKVSNHESVTDPPKRIVFGLPHNYFFSSTNNKADFKPVSTDKSKPPIDRRSSPLFIHIHRFNNGQYAAIVSIIPSVFLPEDAKIQAGKNYIECDVDYAVLHNFLDGYKGLRDQKTKTAYFPNKISVLSPSLTTKETS